MRNALRLERPAGAPRHPGHNLHTLVRRRGMFNEPDNSAYQQDPGSATASPDLGTTDHQLGGASMTAGSPVLGTPELGQVHQLEGAPLEVSPLSPPPEQTTHHRLPKAAGIGVPPPKPSGRPAEDESEFERLQSKLEAWIEDRRVKQLPDPKQWESCDYVEKSFWPRTSQHH